MLTVERLSQQCAKKLIKGAALKAEEIGVPMCIAVTDESGNLIAFERMNGGKIHSIQVAMEKAFTSASTHKPTHIINQNCAPGGDNYLFGIHTASAGRLCVVGGGFPIEVNGTVVGGIGVSSGSPAQDMECAQAGIEYYTSA